MLEITTKPKAKELIKIDKFEYTVRNMGVGEGLSIQQSQNYIDKVQKKIVDGTVTDEEKAKAEELSQKIFTTIIGMIDSQGNKEAQSHFDQLEAEELVEVVGTILEAMNEKNKAASGQAK